MNKKLPIKESIPKILESVRDEIPTNKFIEMERKNGNKIFSKNKTNLQLPIKKCKKCGNKYQIMGIDVFNLCIKCLDELEYE